MSKLKDNLIVKLLVAVIIGIILGSVVGEGLIEILLTIKYIVGQFIFFCVPLVIIGFIAPAITSLKSNASKMLMAALAISYISSVGAALLSTVAGYALIPHLNISDTVEGLRELPAILFQLDIPPIMSVISALVLAIVLGLTVIWTKSETFDKLLQEFNNIMLKVVENMIIPILPVFILTTFAGLAYEGGITKQLPVFLKVIVIVIIGHFIWLAVLYGIAGVISKKNPVEVFKHYGPAYLTAVGTMSSAATLPVALKCARKSSVLDPEIADFAVPIGATIHLCGSVLTETFFVMTISQILYGQLPSLGTMLLFIILLGVFAVGAPGVPGGTVMASLGIVISVVGFNDAGVALLLSIFALQDSFGTACNVTGDGAIALMLTGMFKKEKASN
ncbi:dicarboxylate/amino acid:cation symporter [Tissierella sp. Yu-01]|uniref:dicarboxylate/amino acid:cation symporter n=1 Tax=Tissierella sp. Yu-01 TaxID=3035694 RepID=UPI00240D40AE|nr:dicarboxylate/amino acid:cation symporter [Tissierella sp. Yu-01]WFA08636.1 dicarboxylate/amino acid:cation symporter [Tissierella sp. Yu-01]